MSKSFRLVFLAAVLGLTGVASFDSSNFSPDAGVSEKRTASQLFWRSAGTTGWTQSKPEGLLQPISATTNNTISIKLSDIPVGKVIQVGGLKFVKISDDQYLSISLGCADPVLTKTGAQKLLTYKNSAQSYTFHTGCEYQIELWGAEGYKSGAGVGGKGGYVSGRIVFFANTPLYFYIGDQGSYTTIAYNGGGICHRNSGIYCGSAGGGGVDVRTIGGTWNNADSLRSRIMVAGSGGGAGGGQSQNFGYYSTPGAGGGLTGYEAAATNGYYKSTSGTQIAGGKNYYSVSSLVVDTQGYFGYASQTDDNQCCGAGGGGGWYGGGGGCGTSAAGGSAYISGHTGCVAVTSTSNSSPKSGCTTGTTDNGCSISPYGYTFTDTVMIDGLGYQWTNVKGALKQMPNPNGGNYASGVGHTGNGYARITRLN